MRGIAARKPRLSVAGESHLAPPRCALHAWLRKTQGPGSAPFDGGEGNSSRAAGIDHGGDAERGATAPMTVSAQGRLGAVGAARAAEEAAGEGRRKTKWRAIPTGHDAAPRRPPRAARNGNNWE